MTQKKEISINNDILSKDPSKLGELEILQFQNYMSSYIYKIIEYNITLIQKNNHFKYITGEKGKYIDTKTLKTIVNYLGWIKEGCIVLSSKIGQNIKSKQIEFKKTGRSSYNFCGKYINCSNFYSSDENTCNSHHYTHSLLYGDIMSTITFIKKFMISKDIDKKTLEEFQLSMKTICFVTKHMYNELNQAKDLYKLPISKLHKSSKYIANYKIISNS